MAPAPLDLDHAGWLEVLEDVNQRPELRAEALKRIATALISRETLVHTLSERLQKTSGALSRLEARMRQVMNAAVPEGYAVVDEALLPLAKKPNGALTLVPLRSVKPEGEQ